MKTYRVEFNGIVYVSANDKERAEDLILTNLMYNLEYEYAEAEAFDIEQEDNLL